MKDRVAALCEQLGVEQSGSGLAPAVRLCAAAAGMTYETIAKTVEALELEVFGVAPVSVVAPPAEGTKRKRAEPPAAAVKRESSAAAAATPAAPAARKRPRDEDDDFELTKVLSPAERAAESMEKAKKDGAVQDIDNDDDDEPAPKAPPAKKQRLVPVPGPGGCTCKILAAAGDYSRACKAPSHKHECLCKGDAPDPSSCRATGCPCTCKALIAAGDHPSRCRAPSHRHER